MWINDRVKVLKEHRVKKGKIKLRVICEGTIIAHIGCCGMSDEVSEFLIKCDDGSLIEEIEVFLKAI